LAFKILNETACAINNDLAAQFEKREILLRPNSGTQMDSWVEWFLVQVK
jgi:hypothetical protein